MKFKKLKEKIAKWVLKDMPIMQSPIQPIVIKPENLKRFHSQKIIPYYMWNTVDRWVDPDCFVRMFKTDVMNNFLDEIIIKVDETPEGICYSCDLLYRNI